MQQHTRRSRWALAAAAAAAAAALAAPRGVLAKMSWGNDKARVLTSMPVHGRAAGRVSTAAPQVAQLESEVVSFMVIGDWGGSPVAPYTTAGQLQAAAGLAKIAASTASTFIVSPGGNFYGGLDGASRPPPPPPPAAPAPSPNTAEAE